MRDLTEIFCSLRNEVVIEGEDNSANWLVTDCDVEVGE